MKSTPFIIPYSIPSVYHGCKICANLFVCDKYDKCDGLCIEGLGLTSHACNLKHKCKMEELGFSSIELVGWLTSHCGLRIYWKWCWSQDRTQVGDRQRQCIQHREFGVRTENGLKVFVTS